MKPINPSSFTNEPHFPLGVGLLQAEFLAFRFVFFFLASCFRVQLYNASVAEGGHFNPIIKWLKDNSKALTEQEMEERNAKFLELEFELDQVNMAEDADLKDLCPDGWSLTRKWALKQALKDYTEVCHS